MARASITDRLAAGENILMDGGTGSEVQRRGADVLVGATAETELLAWSATANIDHADVVQQVHQDYLRCGADVLISNNFWTTRGRLEQIGLGDRWQEYAEAAAHNAIAARDAMNEDAYVAGGMATPIPRRGTERGKSDCEVLGRDVYYEAYLEHADLLAKAGVDILLPEYIGHVEDCVAAVDACQGFDLPVWLGVRHANDDGTMQFGESFQDLVDGLDGRQVDAILIMCTRPGPTDAALEKLSEAFDGVVGAYPNVGYNPMAPVRGRQRSGPDIISPTSDSPSMVAEYAGNWKDKGVKIIGGCCASGPEHILAMRPIVKGG